jgi:tetratricopeptide (TPR) repeat protein
MGPGAPMLAVAYANIGSSLIGLGRYEEAEDALERGAALAGNADPASFWVGWAMQYHALAALRAGDAARALADVGRGLAIAERRGAPGAKLLPGLLTVRGLALTATGDPTGGQASCDKAVALIEAHGPLTADRVYEWDALTCSAEALLARGRASDAVALLERSVALTRRVRPAELARAEGALARATADGESARSADRSTPGAKREP